MKGRTPALRYGHLRRSAMIGSNPERSGRRRLPVAFSALAVAVVLAGVIVATHVPALASTIEPGQSTPIVGVQSGRCLDITGASSTNGAQAQLWDCTGATNQRWTYTSGKQLMVYGGKCLDASGHGTSNGTAA